MQIKTVAPVVQNKIRPPLLTVLGNPRDAAELLFRLQAEPVTCYHMDLFDADSLRDELGQWDTTAEIVTSADLWDISTAFVSILYLPPRAGERILKIDMVEQAYHVLAPGGVLVVVSPHENDQLFPILLKKVFGQVHTSHVGEATVFWCHRRGDRPRRRHEVTFHARLGEAPSLSFLSRPGVFSYGRMDDGARALVETMQVPMGARILDLGSGCGTNGIFAARQAGPGAHVTFVDSNLRALVLSRENAIRNGIESFDCLASWRLDDCRAEKFDLVLANPPYYAQDDIALRFVAHAKASLKPGCQLFLVTKRVQPVAEILSEHFEDLEMTERRGYGVFCAQ